MRLTKKIKYNIKRAMPALVVAGAGFMTSCGNDDEPAPIQTRDIELEFYEGNGSHDYSSIDDLDKMREYAADPTIANIYMVVLDRNNYRHCQTINLHYLQEYMEKRTNISPKIHGRGNFKFPVGVVAKSDSLWFVKQGWTINKHLEKQR